MPWLDEALAFLKREHAPVITEVGGKIFSDETFTEIKAKLDPLHSHFDVSTLSALRDMIQYDFEKLGAADLPMIHIANFAEVRLVSGVSDAEGRRRIFAIAKPLAVKGFNFNNYIGLENFIIGAQANFAPSPDRDYLQQIASKVIDGAIATAEDDGVSQQVTVNASIALKGTEKLRSRVALKPFRTFADVDQPESEFILRARKGDKGIEMALFEADGGRWQIAAVENIAFRLNELKITLPVIA